MRKLIFTLLFAASAFAQSNVDFVSQLNPTPSARYSDIWGYVAPDGTEYALMGGYTETFIISLADPANPQIVDEIGGPTSIWRDIKVHENYAYVTTEGAGPGTGLQIIDLSFLPDSAVLVNTLTQYFTTAHNIFIDDGYAYVIGTSGIGGMHILDLSDPVNPLQTAYYTGSGYIHDVYVWSDTVVAAAEDSYDLVDVTDKNNPFKISESFNIPGIYAHSGWMTEDKRYFFGTEEFNNVDITVWDLQDRTSWQLVVPSWEMPANTTVHNLFIKDDYAHVSYYGSGYVVLDISNPEAPILAGQYNTGNAWGCYPYLPSGLVIISDINSGLYVLDFTGGDIPPQIQQLNEFNLVINSDPVSVNFRVLDNSSVEEVVLYYRLKIDGSTGEWNSISSYTLVSNSEYQFEIPGQNQGTEVEYYIAARDDLDQVTTAPEGGGGLNPTGSVPPPQFYSYKVIIPGVPIINSFSPSTKDTTVSPGTILTFKVSANDTSSLPLNYTWYVNSARRGGLDSLKVSTTLGAVPRVDTVKVSITNGYFTTENIWLVRVEEPTSVSDLGEAKTYSLAQNYPNPFNPGTNIKFSIAESENVSLVIYNLLGQEIVTLINEYKSAGTYNISFNAEGLSAGIYIARLEAGRYIKTIKMTLLK